MVLIGIILVFCLICVVGGIVQYIKTPKPPNGLTYQEYQNYYSSHGILGKRSKSESDVSETVLQLLENGQKIRALRKIRSHTGCSLAEAVQLADQLLATAQLEDDDFPSVFEIDGMDGHEFEHFCANIMRKNGFTNVAVTKGSGDQGVDILAEKDGIKYAVQCKNYSSPLSNTPIQEVNAGKIFYNCHVGVVMTNSTFTPGAKTLAQATGVLLWDRAVVEKMMKIANEE